MADFNIRSDSVDVEQIMSQIRSRIREKRGLDYTEDQVRELATVRLEKFLDPKNLRSDLLEQFRKSRPGIPPLDSIELPYTFDDQTLFATHRGPLAFARKMLRPVLKLFFNPNTLNQILDTQAKFNGEVLKQRIAFDRSRAEWNALYYEVLHNLVLETTRTGIEVKNLKMRVESLSSRLDFSERRVRALEGVVQYRPEAVRSRDRRPIVDEDAPEMADQPQAEPAGTPSAPGDATGRRRRRRRRGRRGPGPGQGGDATAQPQSEGAAGDVIAGDSDADLDADSDPMEDVGGGDLDATNEPDSDPGDANEQ
jgi:hypothetical protein